MLKELISLKIEKNYAYFLVSFWSGFLLAYSFYQWAYERAVTTFKAGYLMLSEAFLFVVVGLSFYFLLKVVDKGITRLGVLYFGMVFLLCLIFSVSYLLGMPFQFAKLIYTFNPFFTLQSLMHLLLVFYFYKHKKSNLD